MSDYNTDIGPGLSPGLGEAPKAPPPRPTDDELLGAAFRTQNSLGSVIQRMSRGSYTPQTGYNPIDDIKGWDTDDYYRNHGSTFLGSQSPQESQAIKAEIDKAKKDREALAAGGWNGTVAGLGIGLVDPTMFLPMGNAARLAKLGLGATAETALSVGKAALMQSTAQEALLQASQPERTLGESAINVGTATILSALIGAGAVGLLAKDGLLEKGLSSLDDARVKLSEHNGVMERPAIKIAKAGKGYNILDHEGNVLASADIGIVNIDGKKLAQIDDIYTPALEGVSTQAEHDAAVAASRNVLGTSQMREAMRQFLEMHPDVEGFTGNRVSGARNAGRMGPENIQNITVGRPGAGRTGPAATAADGIPSARTQEAPGVASHGEAEMDPDLMGPSAYEPLNTYNEDQRLISGKADVFDAGGHVLPIQSAEDYLKSLGIPTAAGAAVSDTRNLSPVPYGLDSIPGVSKGVSKMFPNLDVLTNSQSPRAKAALSEMVDTPIALQANKEGQTATRYGGPTVERELKQVREGLHWQTDQEMLNQWGAYLDQGEGGASFFQRETGRGPAGKMTFDEFDGAVYDALSTGDAHPVPQVAAMAQWIRKKGLDPIKERAANAIEGFQETTSRPGETYAPRNWDKEKISKNWNDYVGTWTDHLEAEQAKKAQSQERLGVFQGAMESHRATIDKYEGRIAKLEKDTDVIAARQEETTRVNKAANRRSETLRESQYRNEGGIRVDVPGKGLENARGGSLFETLARNRGNLLADRASAKLSEIESLQQKLATEIESHDTMRAKIEAEIAAWEGKSATEAKAALKARAEAEKAREVEKAAGTYKGKDERLTAADKAVDSSVKQILQSERALSRQELKSRAEEIAGRVIGTPEGRLPYDTDSTTGAVGPGNSELRGHAAHREIDIPYEMAKPWLDRSAARALKSYTHSVLPDALLAERFHGDPNLTNVLKEIESDYAAKRAAATSETAQAKLQSQMDSDIRNVAAMRDRNRGTFAYDPTMQGLARFSQNALKVNNIISSHGMAVASLPDFAGVVFRHGIESAFGDAWIPFSRSLMDNEAWAAVKAAGDEWKAFGIGIETHSASRNHALSDIAENYRPTSKFERALTWASDKAFIANLLAPLTDIQKRMATNAVASNILRAAEAVAGGKATAKQIQRLAEGNITEAQAARIWEQWSNNGGERVKGIILPNMANWTDQAAAKVFRGAVGRDVDIAVVQPGYGEIPKFMSKPGYNVLTQYKKFTMSATQRILISNLQRHDAGSMAGMVTAVGMGMLAYRINTMASGQKTSDRVQDWFKEGVSRGGILGVIDDSNSIVSKATGGKADLYRLMGADKPLSKYVSVDAASMFLGPSYGKLTNFMKVTRAATHPSEWNEADSHALRMMTLGTNFPYLPRLFDKVEAGANHAFGIPMKAKP